MAEKIAKFIGGAANGSRLYFDEDEPFAEKIEVAFTAFGEFDQDFHRQAAVMYKLRDSELGHYVPVEGFPSADPNEE